MPRRCNGFGHEPRVVQMTRKALDDGQYMADLLADIRVIAHFDIDCFYAQSEVLRCPSLKGRPVGVTQKFLVVTTNYVARDLGVPKMVPIDEAKKVLPALVLVNGEDLTPYRAESKQIMAVLGRYGVVQRSGLDEGAVDITPQVKARLQCGVPAVSFSGHKVGWEAVEADAENVPGGTFVHLPTRKLSFDELSAMDTALLVGSQVVFEMRSAVEMETGFHCSCGVAQNKMLAKLASSLNKPRKQTCLLSGAVESFIAPLRARKIPGVGSQTELILCDMGVQTIADLKTVSLSQLSERVGARVGQFLYDACRGRDFTPVVDKGPPKSITIEDSFRNCRTLQQAEGILRVLAPDLIKRLDEDRDETGRRPKTFTLKWRLSWTKWNFGSVSSDLPVELLSASMSVEERAAVAVEVALKLLLRSLGREFEIVVLNIGVTNFVESASGSPGLRGIRSFLQGQENSPRKGLKVTSKNDARVRRESYKKMVSGELDVTTIGGNLGLNVLARADRRKPSDSNIFGNGLHVDDYQPTTSSGEEDGGWNDLASELRSVVRGNGSIPGYVSQSQSSRGVLYQVQHPQSDDVLQIKSPIRAPLKTSQFVSYGQSSADDSKGGMAETVDSQLAVSMETKGQQSEAETVGSGRHGLSSRRKILSETNSSKKKRKSRNGTLDGFVIRN